MITQPSLHITCKHPQQEIKDIISFVAKYTKAALTKVHVNIKNCGGSYAGMAYSSVPRMSNAPAGTKMLVTLRIGGEYMFPKNNIVTRYKWEKRPRSDYLRSKSKHLYRSCSKTVNGKTKRWMEKKIEFKHPYGGKSAPLITVENWKEALVAIAAHEFNHINQYQNDLPCSEVECEQEADRILNLYRKQVQA